jgi:RuvB-like protein 1
MKIEEIKTTGVKSQRVDAHSHLRALGLREDGTAEPVSSGFAGQEAAREVTSDQLTDYRLLELSSI